MIGSEMEFEMFDGGPALQFSDNPDFDLQNVNFPDALQFNFSNQEPVVQEQNLLSIGIDPNEIENEIFSCLGEPNQPTFPSQDISYPYFYPDTEQNYHTNIDGLPPITSLKEPSQAQQKEVKHSVKLEPRSDARAQPWIPDNINIQPQHIQSNQFENIFPSAAETCKVLGQTRVIATPLSVDTTQFQVILKL